MISDSHVVIRFLILLSDCVPPIANGSLTIIFDTFIILSFKLSNRSTCFTSITSSRSEMLGGISSGSSLEKQYGLWPVLSSHKIISCVAES